MREVVGQLVEPAVGGDQQPQQREVLQRAAGPAVADVPRRQRAQHPGHARRLRVDHPGRDPVDRAVAGPRQRRQPAAHLVREPHVELLEPEPHPFRALRLPGRGGRGVAGTRARSTVAPAPAGSRPTPRPAREGSSRRPGRRTRAAAAPGRACRAASGWGTSTRSRDRRGRRGCRTACSPSRGTGPTAATRRARCRTTARGSRGARPRGWRRRRATARAPAPVTTRCPSPSCARC